MEKQTSKLEQSLPKQMKRIFLLSMMVIGFQFTFAQVKIGDNASELSKYSLLELESKTKALLLPRMSNAERDQAFSQETPEGMMIFNTDKQMIQYFYYPLSGNSPSPGKQKVDKIWNTAGEEVYTEDLPGVVNPGDLFYNEDTNILYVWDKPEGLWIPINGGTAADIPAAGVTNPTLTASDTLSGTGSGTTGGNEEVIVGPSAPTTASVADYAPGILYANTVNGDLYVAVDRNSDGTSDAWDKVNSSGGGGGGGGSTPGPAGAAGPVGAAGPPGAIGLTGPAGPTGTGIVSGTGIPTAGTVTPTAGSIYVDQNTGGLWTVSGTTWTQQGTDNLGDHTATQHLDLGAFSIVDNSGLIGTTGQILSRTTTGTLWIENTGGVLSAIGSPTSITAASTTASATAGDLYVDGATGEIWTVSGTTWVQQQGGGGNLYTEDNNFDGNRVATLTGTNTLTFGGTASNTVIYNTNVRVNQGLLDSDGDVGQAGQILTSTGAASNTVNWVYPGGVLALRTGNYTIADEGSLYVRPSGSVTITLPDPNGDDGRKVTVKRADTYTTGNTLTVVSAASSLIDGASAYNLNLSYQGYTFEAFGNEWHIIQRF